MSKQTPAAATPSASEVNALTFNKNAKPNSNKNTNEPV